MYETSLRRVLHSNTRRSGRFSTASAQRIQALSRDSDESLERVKSSPKVWKDFKHGPPSEGESSIRSILLPRTRRDMMRARAKGRLCESGHPYGYYVVIPSGMGKGRILQVLEKTSLDWIRFIGFLPSRPVFSDTARSFRPDDGHFRECRFRGLEGPFRAFRPQGRMKCPFELARPLPGPLRRFPVPAMFTGCLQL